MRYGIDEQKGALVCVPGRETGGSKGNTVPKGRRDLETGRSSVGRKRSSWGP